MYGAYRGFWANNIQADWVHIDDIDQYTRLYLPIPVMLNRATADRLKAWVEAGGTLIAEGCPAYWGEQWMVGTVQPNYGLDELFGARESYVEFTPDLLRDLRLTVKDQQIWGGTFMQAYEPTTGAAVGWYEDGSVAAVEHRYGKGRTLLVGTMAGVGNSVHAGKHEAAPFFASLLAFGDQPQPQHVVCSDPRVKARLHDGEGGRYLWVANPTREPIPVRLTVNRGDQALGSARALWGPDAAVAGDSVELTVPARDVAVLALD
jgi:beta-galactosidase